ncbi:MAG: hypothetical protein HDR33_07465 [Treponema sp.]|nr:hypothetical protein [Treponema sp.]
MLSFARGRLLGFGRTSVAPPYEARDTAGLGSKGCMPVRQSAQRHNI